MCSWYILHQTLIVALAYWVSPFRLGPVLDPVVVVGGTIAGCLCLHEFAIRRSGALRPLFGLKSRRPAASAPVAALAAGAQSGN